MTNQAIIETPLRLGYFLLEQGVTLYSWPSVPYRGIDRLPDVPSPLEHQNLTAAGHGDLVQLWVSFWDEFEPGEIHTSLASSLHFQQAFRRHGYDFELIFAKLLEIPPRIEEYPHGQLWLEDLDLAADRLVRIHERIGHDPTNVMVLGVDISHPTVEFHSAIFQPGFHRRVPDLPRYLNDYGLLPSIEVARPLVDEANAMDYGAFPFCAIEISHVT